MEASLQLQAPVVYTRRQTSQIRSVRLRKEKFPFLYGEAKDDSSATLPVVHPPFHLSYLGSEETGKYEIYEIKG
jgi:hypothetical protein